MTLVSRFAALLLAFASLPAFAQAMDPSDLPPVDSVFQLSASAPARDRIELRWKIAPGYYLYRHRTKVEVLGNGFQAGELQIPAGKKHHDEFFGDVETYRGELKVSLPGKAAAGTDALALRVKYQGCADVGVCYPPQTRTVSVSLPAGGNDASADAGFAALGASLGQGAGGAQAGGLATGQNALPLPPAQAFKVEAIADGGSRLLLRVTPARGYYLYRDKLKLALTGAQGVSLGKPNYPKADDYRDEYFGNVKVYFDQAEIPVPLIRTEAGAKAQTITLNASWQGCQKNGICYEPMKNSYRLLLPAAASTAKTQAVATAAATPGVIDAASPTTADANNVASVDNNAASPSTGATALDTTTNGAPATSVNEAASPSTATPTARIGLLTALLLALGGGLILNLMPCVLPVLSLKALSLAQSGESRDYARSHALAYTFGVLVAFAALGAIVLALRGQLVESGIGWGFQLQMPRVVAVLALVVFAFGLSLSGLWYANVAVPQSGLAMSQRGGWRGDFVTGVLAVVLATPCTAPFMGAALAYAFLAPAPAAMAVFLIMGLGLALPFLLIGFIPGFARFLPKPGAWMETMKQLLAFPMYATAAWLVWVLAQQRGADAFGLWALAAIALALALWAWTHARRHGKNWALVLAVVALLGSAFSVYSIGKVARPAPAAATLAEADHVAYSPELLTQLRSEGRPVFVNITADWCVTCKANERTVFARDGFREALRNANAVYMVGDHTDVDPKISAFLREHGAVGLPLYVVYPSDGSAPKVLPALLTPSIARDALIAASNKG